MGDINPADLDSIVRTVAGEAGAESPLGQQAVAHVIMNRAASSRLSPSEVVSARGQFESWHSPRVQTMAANSPAYKRTLAVIAPVVNGEALDPTGGATHFLNPTLQSDEGRNQPAWASGDGQKIGNHVFYKVGYSGPKAPSLPASTDELDAIFDVKRGASPTAAPTAPPAATASTNSALPPQDALDKAFGVSRATPGATAENGASGPKPLNPKAAAHYAVPVSDPRLPLLNSVALGALPMFSGGIAAAETYGKNALSHIGIGSPAGYEPGEAYEAEKQNVQGALDAYASKHPGLSTVANIAGIATSLPAHLMERGVSEVAGRIAPKLAASAVGRGATRVAGTAAAAGAYGTNSALAHDEPVGSALGQGAETALLSVPFGAVGEAVGPAVSALKSPVAKAIVPTVANSALGATGGYMMGGQKGAEGGALAGALMGHMSLKASPEGAPTAQDRQVALDVLAKGTPSTEGVAPHTVTADALSRAAPEHTTLEALGDQGASAYKKAVQANPGVKDTVDAALEARADAKPQRLVQSLSEATGIDPSTAQMDAEARTEAARNGPAKEAYSKAITGKGVWTPELAQLAAEPEVRSALNTARRLIGTESLTPNPVADAGRVPDRMTAQELRSRVQSQNGSLGDEVTNSDLLKWMQSGGAGYSAAPDQPSHIPTDATWDLAKKMLDKSVTRDAFGKPEATPENVLRQKWSKELAGATGEAIPGLKDARAISGEYLSNDTAYRNAPSLGAGSKNAETEAAFNKRWDKLSEPERDSTRAGTLADLYRQIASKDYSSNGVLNSTRDQGILKTLFGDQGAGKIIDVLKNERTLGQQARNITSVKPKAEADHGGVLTGALVGMAESGGHPMGAIKGALTGVGLGSARNAVKSIQAGRVTPRVASALGDILSQPAEQTARELRLRHSERREVRLSESALASHPAIRGVKRGVQIGGGMATASALKHLMDERP